MQIARNHCTTCGHRIVFADEGRFCVNCGTMVHLSCGSHAICPVCRGPLKDQERPKPGRESVHFDPRADRSFGPAAAVLFVLLALIAAVAAWLWEAVRPQGH